MKNLYIAGSLFNEAEVNQRIKEGNMIESLTNYQVYNPIQAPCNIKDNLPSSKEIFWGDTKEILKSDTVVADISNQSDPGTAAELGIVWACNYIPWGCNQYLVGMVEDMGIIKNNFQEVLNELV